MLCVCYLISHFVLNDLIMTASPPDNLSFCLVRVDMCIHTWSTGSSLFWESLYDKVRAPVHSSPFIRRRFGPGRLLGQLGSLSPSIPLRASLWWFVCCKRPSPSQILRRVSSAWRCATLSAGSRPTQTFSSSTVCCHGPLRCQWTHLRQQQKLHAVPSVIPGWFLWASKNKRWLHCPLIMTWFRWSINTTHICLCWNTSHAPPWPFIVLLKGDHRLWYYYGLLDHLRCWMMPHIFLEVYQAQLTGWKCWFWARTRWKDYISQLAFGSSWRKLQEKYCRCGLFLASVACYDQPFGVSQLCVAHVNILKWFQKPGYAFRIIFFNITCELK